MNAVIGLFVQTIWAEMWPFTPLMTMEALLQLTIYLSKSLSRVMDLTKIVKIKVMRIKQFGAVMMPFLYLILERT